MKIQRAFFQMVLAQTASLAAMAVGLVVLARLLSPSDFGIFALAMTAFNIAGALVKFGLDSNLVRATDIPESRIDSAAGLSFAIALALVGLGSLVLLALPLGLVDSAAMTASALFLPFAIALLLLPITLVMEARLKHRLEFGLVSIMLPMRVVIDVAVAILLAYLGFGVLALACGVMAAEAISVLILVGIVGRSGLPRPRIGGWAQFFRFGVNVTATGVVQKFANFAIAALIGGAIGMHALGLYNRAEKIKKLLDTTFLDGLKPVVLPAFSRSIDSGFPPRSIYVMKIEILSALCWPGFALIALLAEPLVAVLLGAQWADAAPLVRILAVAGLMLPINALSHKLFVALDMTGAYLRLQIIGQAVRVLLVASAVFTGSLEAVCGALVLAALFKSCLIVRALHPTIAMPFAKLAPAFLRGGILTLATAGIAAVLAKSVAGDGAFVVLIVVLPAAIVVWLSAMACVRHPLLREVVSFIKASGGSARSAS